MEGSAEGSRKRGGKGERRGKEEIEGRPADVNEFLEFDLFALLFAACCHA